MKSLTAAAKALSLPKSSVSRKIRESGESIGLDASSQNDIGL